MKQEKYRVSVYSIGHLKQNEQFFSCYFSKVFVETRLEKISKNTFIHDFSSILISSNTKPQNTFQKLLTSQNINLTNDDFFMIYEIHVKIKLSVMDKYVSHEQM